MTRAIRYKHNPVLRPNRENAWEALATFNGSVVKDNNKFRMVYRAIGYEQEVLGKRLRMSTIGYAESLDGKYFENTRQLIKPEFDWERFGCEDPRITKLSDKYYIFYTALSDWPPSPPGIKIGMALTKDFKTIEKHLVTFFNSKAMGLFPKKINGKFAALLTLNTDLPPSKICIAEFEKEEDIWSEAFWKKWFESVEKYVIMHPESKNDHIELGSTPVETKAGWLALYARIKNYFSPPAEFQIHAMLLDRYDPSKIIGRTKKPLLIPEEEYEIYGMVPHVIFPSGAIIVSEEDEECCGGRKGYGKTREKNHSEKKNKLWIYYGATDTTCCLAECELDELLEEMLD